MTAPKNPLALITFLMACGIITAKYIHLSVIVIAVSCLLLLVITALSYYRKEKDFKPKPYFILCTCLFSFSLGLLLYSFHHAPNNRLHYSHFIKDKENVIEGNITERLKPSDFYERYLLQVKYVNAGKANGKILILSPCNKKLNISDRLLLTQDPEPIRKPLNPAGFDYANYMANKNIFGQYYLKDNYIITGKIKDFNYYIGALREELAHSFVIHHFKPKIQGVITALLLGQRQDMDAEISESYKDAGVMHVLAISGLHIAILFYTLSFITAPLKRLGRRGMLFQLVIILVVLWLFAFISGLSPSVVRAVIMFSFISTGLYINRKAPLINAIIISMLFMLIISPKQLFDVGFQLSYAAVTGIVIFQPLYKKIHISKYRIVNYFIDTAVISTVAQLSVLPLTLYYFGQFPILFLVANIIVIPLTTAILILGITTLAFNFINNNIALLIGKVLSSLIELMNSFIGFISSLDYFTIKNIPFTQLLCILLYGLLFAVIAWLFNKSYKNSIAVLTGILIFQTVYLTTKTVKLNNEKLVIFHNYKSSTIAIKHKTNLTVITNEKNTADNKDILAYRKDNFNPNIHTKPLTNILWHNEKNIFIMDSTGIYSTGIKPQLLIVTQSPKINFEEVITALEPKVVVADGTNYKYLISRWKATCKKYNIPFHATDEKGYYSIK